ncbi:UV radiation resistance protein and autophagy-related subunit 14-domain-containing protein [Phlyctochytrium arcticum]|nr:UV radiation resistance protein and autophagy-related subunit 14-domain-containing protein [Phlyctochytrium arcticum]
MSRLVYLGSEIDEGRRYPPNSLIFGLKGGVYLHDGTLPVTDDLEEGCDDNDLVFQKVPPNKVLASYRYESILRILTAQKHLFETRQAQLATTESGERILNLKDHHLRTEWTRLKSRLAYTEKTIMGLSEDVKNGRQRHIEIREKMASIGSDLDTARGKREIQERELEGLKVGVVMLRDEIYSKTIKVKSRQRELISSLSTLFPITYNDSTTTYTIKSLPLPHSDFTGHDEDGIATALGYTAQCVTTLAMYLGVALRYRIRPMSSRSSIVDPVSELAGGSNEFPLFGKGSEKLRFEYAVFLLNKNIEQIMSTLRLTVSNLRWTLPNLQSILVETQNWPSISEEGEWNDSLESRIPPDTIIIGDHQQQQQQQLETEVLLTIIPEEEGGFSTPRAMSLTNHPDDDILLPQPNNNNLPSSSTSESPTPTPTSSSPIPKRSGIAAFFGYARVQSQPSSPGL